MHPPSKFALMRNGRHRAFVAAERAAKTKRFIAQLNLPRWEPCNPGCDPEFNGERSRHCSCDAAKRAMGSSAPKHKVA